MTKKIVFPDAPGSWGVFFNDERLSRLNSIGEFSIDFSDNHPSPETLVERIGDAEGMISGWGVSTDVLESLPNLKVISFVGLGAASFFDLAEVGRRGVTVTHGLSAASSVAEHTLGLMLAASRNIVLRDREIRQGLWNDFPCLDLKGKTLGLIGYGRIAQFVTPLAQAFGMNVIAWARSPNAEVASNFGMEFVSLKELLASSDVVSLHLHLNEDTEGFLTSDLLRSTKPGVVIVNTARAQLLDETALVELLRSGHIGTMATDVFNEEPLPMDHPFRELDNVLMTPHNAYNTPDATAAMCDVAIDNLEAYFAGNPKNVAT
ncbi:MAG: 3-phosphoglycerate dehydrogenase [Anaerolineae bacterium]|nr:3-phosphoglycerate dehydrogenase [Anaerolineae bacterium]